VTGLLVRYLKHILLILLYKQFHICSIAHCQSCFWNILESELLLHV